jgi:hypothetical protein
MSSQGLAFYVALREGTRAGQSRAQCCSDVPTGAVAQTAPRRRVRKLVTAVGTSLSVFVKLLRRPVGGTTVVLVPREQIPEAAGTVVISDEYEWLPRAS